MSSPLTSTPRNTDKVSGVIGRWGIIALLIAVAVVGGVWGTAVGVPAAWIFSFLLVFGAYAIFGDRQVQPPKKAMIPPLR